MMKIDWATKLTSRKFWAAICEFVFMLLVALHWSEDQATQITALIMAGAGVIAYILGEGLTDAAGAGSQIYVAERSKPPEEEL